MPNAAATFSPTPPTAFFACSSCDRHRRRRLLFLIRSSSRHLCSVVQGQGRGFQYVYPSSWTLDKVRGIEFIAHDPDVDKFNLTITSGPAKFAVLGSPKEVGQALLTRYRTVPNVKEAELLDVAGSDSGGRSYTLELRLLANDELRHFLCRILRTETKVYTLVLQIPEGLWLENADCARTLVDGLKSRGSS